MSYNERFEELVRAAQKRAFELQRGRVIAAQQSCEGEWERELLPYDAMQIAGFDPRFQTPRYPHEHELCAILSGLILEQVYAS